MRSWFQNPFFNSSYLIQIGGLILGPLLAIAVDSSLQDDQLSTEGRRTLGVGVWMAFWWASEVVPIPVTALLPIILFPMLNIAAPNVVGASFGHPLIFLFLGGFILALSLEKANLHRRMALSILLRTGSKADGLLLGFMLASALISMWVTNTATTMMIMPIALSIVEVTRFEHQGELGKRRHTILTHSLLLGIAYASTIGGLGTLVGTVPNALLAAFVQDQFGFKISFSEWMKIGVPLAVVLLPVTWWVLARWQNDLRQIELPHGREEISGQLVAMGPWSFHQQAVFVIFLLTAMLWIFRPMVANLFHPQIHLTDEVIAISAAIVLFIVPASLHDREFLMDWDTAKKLPWDVLLLFGGGLSLAAAMRETGASEWIGVQLQLAAAWPSWTVIALVATTIIFLTELTSNTATTATFLPIIAALALSVNLPPMILLVPATIAASCAFMLPVATPPNAIVYGSGKLTIKSMMKAGWALNIAGILILVIFSKYFLPFILGD